MKVAVRYQSRGGNTKAVAERIANNLEVKAETTDTPIDEFVDVLFVGGGVYMSKPDKSLSTFLKELNKENVGQIVCFSTSGSAASTIKQIKKIAAQNGIFVNENQLLIKMYLQGHSAFGLTGGKLTEKQIDKIDGFVRDALRSE